MAETHLDSKTEVGYALNSLSNNFNQVQWENLSFVLFSSALSKEETDFLAKLLVFPKPNVSTHDVLFAFQEALTQIQEFTDLYRGITSIDDEFFKQTIKTLGLNEYLASGKMSQEIDDVLESSDKTAVQIENLSLHLQIFKILQSECPVMFQKSSLKSLGLTQENETKLDKLETALRSKTELTGVIGDALKKIEASYLLQRKIKTIQNLIKRKSWSGFSTKLTELYETMKAEYQAQKQQLEIRKQNGDEITRLQIQHQEDVLNNLEILQEYFFKALIMASERELFQGIKYVNGFLIIHQQILQVYDNSVALTFVGLIKTGKSTIVDTIIGETISPSRIEPMTSIPVRYIHDPSAADPNNPNKNNPTMLVPFAPQLNKVLRLIRKLSNEIGVENFQNALPKSHLKHLHQKIMDGLVFKKIYQGSQEVLDASIDIHDLFRLVAQDTLSTKFNHQLIKELPHDWSKGLDYFLTVSLNFPDFGHGDFVKLSIVDTPGVNEAGVGKLDLYKVIRDTVDVCHYVAFTLVVTSFESNDTVPLKRLIIQIETHSMTPTLVLATNSESIMKKEQDNLRSSISHFLQNEFNQLYPPDSVYFVSGKKKLLGKKMIECIEKHNGKPPLAKNELAENWALFAGVGDNNVEKKEYYEELKKEKTLEISTRLLENANQEQQQLLNEMIEYIEKHGQKPSIYEDNFAFEWASFIGYGDGLDKMDEYESLTKEMVIERSKKAIQTSNMKPPMDTMITTAFQEGIQLSCNKAIEKSVFSAKDLSNYLSQLVQINKAEKLEAQNLINLSEEVFTAISIGASEIKANIGKYMIEFKESMGEDTSKLITDFVPELDQLFGGGEWNFATKEDAEKKINERLLTAQMNFSDLSYELLSKKQDELRKYANDLKGKTEDRIFNQLQRITCGFLELQNDSFVPVLPEIKISLDIQGQEFNSHLIKSQEQSTSLREKFSSVLSGKMFKSTKEVFDVDVDEIKKFVHDRLTEFQKDMTNITSKQVDDELHKALDFLFLQALKRVYQLREALVQREKLAVDPAKIEDIFNNVKTTEIKLANLKTNTKKEAKYN